MSAPDSNGSIPIYRLLGIVSAFIILASIVSFSSDLFAVDLSWFYDIKKAFNQKTSIHANEDANRSGPSEFLPKTVSSLLGVAAPSDNATADQTWCFLGEDMVGRWCIQVSAPNLCPVERSFSSKNKCEKH